MNVLIFTDKSLLTTRLGAYRIASSLRSENINVEVIDYLSYWTHSDLLKLFNKFNNIAWVGFSLPYLVYSKTTDVGGRLTTLPAETENWLFNHLKQCNIPIVLGGSNAKSAIDNIPTSRGYYIITGYADNAILALHYHIVHNSPILITEINSNKVIDADKDYPVSDLTNLVTNFTESDFIQKKSLIPIEISRGCIFKCAFCEFSYLGKKPGTYFRDKQSIKTEIQNAIDLGSDTFIFSDNTFNDSLEKMELIKSIRDEINVPFYFWAYGRLDLFVAYPKMIDLIGDIGWKAMSIGLETLNRDSGKAVHKGGDPEKLKKCLIEIRRRYPEIHLQINLIVGLPRSTREDIKDSIDWLLENNIANYIRVIDLDIRDPGSKLSGSLISRNPSKYGYTILSTDKIRYNWENEGWSNNTASLFADEMNKHINNKISQGSFMSQYNKKYLTHVPKEYVENKLKN